MSAEMIDERELKRAREVIERVYREYSQTPGHDKSGFFPYLVGRLGISDEVFAAWRALPSRFA